MLWYLLRAIERSLFALRARLPRFCGYCFFITDDLTLFPILLSPYRQTAMFSSQCPCRMIWFEEILKGSYKVVLCPRSGEGYFGLARRTYSLQCPPDIAAVRLFRFTLRISDEAIPNRGSRTLRCRSRERSMALPQLPAYAQHQLDQRGIILNDLKVPKVLIIPKEPSIRVALFISPPLTSNLSPWGALALCMRFIKIPSPRTFLYSFFCKKMLIFLRIYIFCITFASKLKKECYYSRLCS